jgi:hypothetical protein
MKTLGLLAFLALLASISVPAADATCAPSTVKNVFYSCFCGNLNIPQCVGSGTGCNPSAGFASCCGGQIPTAATCHRSAAADGHSRFELRASLDGPDFSQPATASTCGDPTAFNNWLAEKLSSKQ